VRHGRAGDASSRLGPGRPPGDHGHHRADPFLARLLGLLPARAVHGAPGPDAGPARGLPGRRPPRPRAGALALAAPGARPRLRPLPLRGAEGDEDGQPALRDGSHVRLGRRRGVTLALPALPERAHRLDGPPLGAAGHRGSGRRRLAGRHRRAPAAGRARLDARARRPLLPQPAPPARAAARGVARRRPLGAAARPGQQPVPRQQRAPTSGRSASGR
jgi:hypothetical protein